MFKKQILLAVALFAFIPACARADTDVDQPAPALIVKQLDGTTFNLAAQEGRVVIVNFWATWCPPCRDEMPLLDTIYKRYRGQGLIVLGVSVDKEKRRWDVAEIAKKYAYPMAMGNDAQANDFGWTGAIPDTYIIDRKGILRVKFESEQLPLDEKAVGDILEPLLAKQK